MVNVRILSPVALATVLVAGVAAVAGCRSSCTTCHDAPAAAVHRPTPAASNDVADPVRAQAERGAVVYAQQCARCHGAGGEGSASAPAVVGASALPLDPPATRKLRRGTFRTAADVAQFVVTTMPPGGPKIAEADAWAVLGFDLKANGVTLAEPVGPHNAASIVLHK